MLVSLLYPDRSCDTCTAALKVQRGCVTKATMPMLWDGVDVWECLRRPFKEDPGKYNEIFRTHSWFKKGMLPDPGQWPDQPNILIEYMTIVDAAVAEAEKQEMEKLKRRK